MLREVMTAPYEIEFHEIPIPKVAPGKVLIRMINIGICGSDIHVYHGNHPFTSYPVTQGHEVSGIVEEVGANVNGLYPGQKVTIEPQVVCGKCHPCRNGKYNLCENLKVMGFQTTGAASAYFLADAFRVTPLPDGFSMEDGAMIEPLAVAVHAVHQAGEIAGKNVVVEGAGPIGNLVMQVAKGLGAARVMITDVSDYRLALAGRCGADFCVNVRERAFSDALLDCFGPDKADVLFDCAGTDDSMNNAIRYVRKGSLIILVAVFAGMANVDLAVANDHELTIGSSMMYRHEDYADAIRLVQGGKVNLPPLVSARFAFRDYLKAYRYIDENQEKTMKVLINVAE